MQDSQIKVTGIKPSSMGMFVGTFGLLLGLAIALWAWIAGTANATSATGSLVQGLLFGFTAGLLTLIVVPLIYFAIGWVIGAVHGLVFTAVAQSMGGIQIGTQRVDDELDAAPARPRRTEPQFGETVDHRRR